jgi:deazaflavin-dependent oxidoreductase (nitroreductase family)
MASTKRAVYPPRGLLRWAFRAPVSLYRMGLGWLFGGRLVLINHVGRKSGTPYQTVVEVVERDKQAGTIVVVAGYGERTQWYQNLRARPETIIQLGTRRMRVRAELLSPDEGADILLHYIGRYPLLARELFHVIGYGWDGTPAGAQRIAREDLRFVRFHPA